MERMRLTPASALALRFRANGLHDRTGGPVASQHQVLQAGLQDTTPRAAQVSLAARVANPPANAWADPALLQVWGPRNAVYLIAASDREIFTLGRLPRTAEADEIRQAADRVADWLGDRELDPVIVRQELGLGEFDLRFLARSGRLLIRWNASTITVRAAARPEADPVECQRELLRRFVRTFGPTDVAAFAAWAKLSRADATATLEEIRPDFVEVDIDGSSRLVAATAAAAGTPAASTPAVRLLPAEDPYLRLDRDWLVPHSTDRRSLFPPHATGAIRGAILADSLIVGWWQRQGGTVGIHPFDTAPNWADAAETEARSLPIAGGITRVDIAS